jgi:caa(3)-type oxidase subunit IV
MSADTKHADHGHGDPAHGHHDEAAHIKRYTQIYFILLALFLVSVAGPFVGALVGSKALVLATAFGIALIKAYLVCANFMHLNIEKRYITYLLTTTIVFVFLFFAGVSPDVMEHRGRNWENVSANHETERALKADAEAGEAGEHHGEHGEREEIKHE